MIIDVTDALVILKFNYTTFKSFTNYLIYQNMKEIKDNLYSCHKHFGIRQSLGGRAQLQMLLFPNTLCCSLYERNCVCAVTKIFTKFLPANNFCQLLRVTRKRRCTSAGNAQAQLHFQDDQQRAFGISNISICHSHSAVR